MSIHFSSSTRAIQSVGRKLSLVGLAITLVFVGVWGGWFVGGTIVIYETSSPVVLDVKTIAHTPVVPVTFRASARDALQPGQEATLWLDDPPAGAPAAIPVRISDIQPADSNQPVHTTVEITSPAAFASLPEQELAGRVRVPIGRVSPLSLFLQETGWPAALPFPRFYPTTLVLSNA
jgi:hypothetical protein